MAKYGNLSSFLVLCILLGIVGSTVGQLQLNFYAKSCPQAEKIIQEYVQKQIPNAPDCISTIALSLYLISHEGYHC